MKSDSAGRYILAAEDDCLSSVAEQYGYLWKTLWLDSNNAGLRSLRGDPNVLQEGDCIYLPPKDGKEINCPTDKQHVFLRRGVPSMFRVRLLNDKEPRANVTFTLDIDGKLTHGTTDSDGRIEVPIPPSAETGRLTVGEGEQSETFTFDLGHLKPVSEPEGALKRLESLSYDGGLKKQSGLKLALKTFQADQALRVTGELDPATQNALRNAYGC